VQEGPGDKPRKHQDITKRTKWIRTSGGTRTGMAGNKGEKQVKKKKSKRVNWTGSLLG